MNFLKNLIIFFGTILLYLHIYIHFKISSTNEFSQIKYNSVDDLSKQKIMTTIYYKLPFVFDGTTIIKPFDLKDIKKNDKNQKDKKDEKNVKDNEKIYKKTYEKMSLLEPSVRFFTKDSVYELKKNKMNLHKNLECRNFYLIHTGKVIIYCIHPKYKNQIDEINLSKSDKPESKANSEKMKTKEIEKFIENDDILHVELHPNSILFVPNYWYVCIKGVEKSLVEKVQYKTILNEVNFLYDKYIQVKK
jgi:hypothetical protein